MPYTICPETKLVCNKELGVTTNQDFVGPEEEIFISGRSPAYYNDTQVVYQLDSRGFRNPQNIEEYKTGYVLALGCSNTFGSGNAYNDLWHVKLAAALGTKSLNLGIQGSNLDISVINSMRLMQHFSAKPSVVIYQHPEINRKLLVKRDDELLLMADENYSREQLEADANDNIVTEFYKKAIFAELADNYWQALGIPVYHFTFGSDGITPYFRKIVNFDHAINPAGEELPSIARDLTHDGPSNHQRVADYFIQQLQNLEIPMSEENNDNILVPEETPEEELTDEEILKRKLEMLRKRDPFVYR